MDRQSERIEELAAAALGFIAADERLSATFLGSTGLEAGDLRKAAGNAEFTGFVLDFIAEDDRRLLDFAARAGLTPQDVMRMRAILAGPGSEGWAVD